VRTETLSIRIRKDLKDKMRKVKIDWRKEIEGFIESKIREIEAKEIIDYISSITASIPASSEPAWKSIREYRERG